jgi:hypothetical protein
MRTSHTPLVLAILLLGALPAGPLALAERGPRVREYEYLAVIATRMYEGPVRVGKLVWHCRSRHCTISGPWVSPRVRDCRRLARHVGRIAYFGRRGEQLSAEQLRQCNARLGPASSAETPHYLFA